MRLRSARVGGGGGVLLSAFLLLSLVPASARAIQIPELSGQVRNEGSEEPVAEAWVELLDPEGRSLRRILTDDAGAFLLHAPEPGSWRLRVSRRGFRAHVTPAIEVGGTPVRELLIRIAPSSPPTPRSRFLSDPDPR